MAQGPGQVPERPMGLTPPSNRVMTWYLTKAQRWKSDWTAISRSRNDSDVLNCEGAKLHDGFRYGFCRTSSCVPWLTGLGRTPTQDPPRSAFSKRNKSTNETSFVADSIWGNRART